MQTKFLICYNEIQMCYFEISPHAMKCTLCHHLHSVFSIPIRDDTKFQSL